MPGLWPYVSPAGTPQPQGPRTRLPRRTVSDGEQAETAAIRELEEETGYSLADGAALRPMGAYYSVPSETNKYAHAFLASPVVRAGDATGDTEIEKYFDMSVVLTPADDALHGIGTTITSMETVGELDRPVAALVPSAPAGNGSADRMPIFLVPGTDHGDTLMR